MLICILWPSIGLTQSTISGHVWFDINADGYIDQGELPATGIPVYLFTCNGIFTGIQSSNTQGDYSFTNLPNGQYKVYFDITNQPSNVQFTLINAQTDNHAFQDGFTDCIEVNNESLNLNGGLTSLSNIGDRIWEDLNGNGLQDQDEPGVSGCLIILYDENDNYIDFTFTNTQGIYSFDLIFPGSYYIITSPPAGYIPTLYNQAGQNINNDIRYDYTSDVFVHSNLAHTSTIDGGFYRCAKTCGFIYSDTNKDDLLSAGEKGINGLEVQIYQVTNGDTLLFATQLTSVKPNSPSEDGYYEFCTPPGIYFLKVVIPQNTNLFAGIPFVGNNPAIYNHISHANGLNTTNTFTLSSGDEQCNINNGFYCGGSIGNRVWYDEDNNGLQDSGELDMNDIMIHLYDGQNNFLAQYETNGSGVYVFDSLPKGHYYLHFFNPDIFTFSPYNVGGNTNIEYNSKVSNANGPGTTHTFYLGGCENISYIDCGLTLRPLPLMWGPIQAYAINEKQHRIDWSIHSALNIQTLTIQRSSNGIVYGDIKSIQAINEPYNIEYKEQVTLDESDSYKDGPWYYRIKSTEFDGTVEYSPTVVISPFSDKEGIIKIQPNPFSDNLKVGIISTLPTSAHHIIIYNMSGKAIWQQPIDKNNPVQDINTISWLAGQYIITVVDDYGLILQQLPIIKQ